MTVTKRASSTAGSGKFADQWHTHTGRKAREEAESRQIRQRIAKAKYTISKAVEVGQIEEALAAAEEILECGEAPANELLYKMLSTAAELPGVERFAKVVNCCTKSNLTMEAMQWASLIGRLMARDAPHAQVRVCLNFGVPKDGTPLELVPVEANRDSDVQKVFAGAEHLDLGELSDEEDIAAAAAKRGVNMEDWASVPKAVMFSIGGVASMLAGEYKRCKQSSAKSGNSQKAIYKKQGETNKHIYVYYYTGELTVKDPKLEAVEERWEVGWYIGSEVGGGGITYAYCPMGSRQALAPPAQETWFVLDGKGGKVEAEGKFTKAPEKVKGSDAKVVDWEEAWQLLDQIDLSAIPGRVRVDKDPEALHYFCHFFILLHLEQLAEVAGFRGRFGFRTAKELSAFGIALVDRRVSWIGKYSPESRRMPLPGWPDQGYTKIALKLPRLRGEALNKFGIKPGESVLLSRGHPLQSRVTEGSVTSVDFNALEIGLNVHGRWPSFPNDAMFRVDCYANRTTFERQLTALLTFITMQRTKMQEMLIAARVGKVDMAVLGGDGFADPGKSAKLADKVDGMGKSDAQQPTGDAPESKAPRSGGVMTASQVRAMLESRNSGAGGETATTSTKASQEPAGVATDDNVEGTPELDNEINSGRCRQEAQPGADEDLEGFEEIQLEPEGGEEDEAARLARELASQFEADGQEAGAKLRDLAPKADSNLAPSGQEVRASELDAIETEEEAKKRKLDEELAKLPEEERVKRATLALADEDAEGIDMDRLAEAQEMVKQLPDLSAAQRFAIVNSLSKRLTIVQGPPGTGKTHTSVRILTMWAKQMRYKPLLATSECNIAVDNIADGLARAGVKVVRVGKADKVHEVLEGVCLENMVKAAQLEREAARGDESELEELGEEPPDEESEEYMQWKQLQSRHRRKHQEERKLIAYDKQRFMEEAEVLCATTINSGSQAFSGFKFHGILIDEVAQATETSALVPIIMRGAKQIALCGDHCQLPPSTVSREAELRGMSLSLYSRLVEAGVPFQFLDTQYRAHPALMAFSAACIYQGKLKNGIAGSQRPVPKGIPWPNPDSPAAFFNCEAEEGLNGESKDNRGEAGMVIKLITDVLACGEIGFRGIGVIAPYKGQVRTLRSMIFDHFPEAIESKELEIASVDNFQGREKELIIFTAVRSNKIASVGFLKDWRRLNVMITRARRGLVVVGNAATLVCDRHWRLWLQFTERQGGCPQGTVDAAIKEAEDNLTKEVAPKKASKLIKGITEGYDESKQFVKKAVDETDNTEKKKKKRRIIRDAADWWDGSSATKKSRWWDTKADDVQTKQKRTTCAEDQWHDGGDDEWWDEEGNEWWGEGPLPKKTKKKKGGNATDKWGDDWDGQWYDGCEEAGWSDGEQCK